MATHWICVAVPGLLLAALLPAREAAPAPVPAPAPAGAPAERLDKLLQELAGTDAKVWQGRLEKLEQQAKAHDQQAADLRAQAMKLQQQAAEADAAAKSVRTEIERLKELQKLLSGGKPTAAPAQTPAPAKPAPDKPAAEPVKTPA